jgi:alpha-L-arabinofuranosidase
MKLCPTHLATALTMLFSLPGACATPEPAPSSVVAVDTSIKARPYSNLLFGGFLEHFHRQIYGGIYEPGSPLADAKGFRKDVIAAIKELRTPIVRWPGGCFVSAYHWKDGVGKDRQPSFDKAWGVEDPNTFGTDEFVEWCRLAGIEPYICGNAGTGTPEEMSDWVEYCNPIHGYWDGLWVNDQPSDFATCMMRSTQPEASITTVERLLDSTGFRGKITIAFDEWNLRGWHHPGIDSGFGPEQIQARDRNDINGTYTMADALFSACFLNSCLRHADTVKMANIAPLVNTRGPLFVHPKGIVKRTTFHTMSMYANLLNPRVAKATVTGDPFQHGNGAVPAVDAVATCDEARKNWRIALVNRHPSATASCGVQFDGTAATGTCQATVLAGDSPEAFNDVERPDRVVPRRVELTFQNGTVALPPHSLTILELARTPLPVRLIGNGGFEAAGDPEHPEGWTATQWNDGTYNAGWSEERPHAGQRCVVLESETGADCAWIQRIEVEPHRKYRLRGWIRTAAVVAGSGSGAFLNVQEIQPVKSRVLTGTNDWTQVELVIDSSSHESLQVNCLLGGWGRSSGKCWFDEITLELLEP